MKTGGCIRNTAKLTLSRVVVTGRTSSLGGGGISSYANLTVSDSTISNNSIASAAYQVNGGGISGGPQSSGAPGVVTITRTTITNNVAHSTRPKVAYGGGFANTAIMNITDSVISLNVADSSAGGLSDPHFSRPAGSLTIARTTFAGNKANRDAGGMTNDGLATINNSTFTGNQAGYQCAGTDCNMSFAGGLLGTTTATTHVNDSTFSGNASGISGGGILQSGNGTMRIASSTIVNNSSGYAGGVASPAAPSTGLVYMMNTIVANNSATRNAPDCGGSMTSQGYNLTKTPCTFIGNTTGNITGVDPGLGALASNGGPTQTHAILAGSRAKNAATQPAARTPPRRPTWRPISGVHLDLPWAAATSEPSKPRADGRFGVRLRLDLCVTQDERVLAVRLRDAPVTTLLQVDPEVRLGKLVE